jgi:hypothetical protein
MYAGVDTGPENVTKLFIKSKNVFLLHRYEAKVSSRVDFLIQHISCFRSLHSSVSLNIKLRRAELHL